MNQPVLSNNIVQKAILEQDGRSLDLASYVDFILENRWIIAMVTSAVALLGLTYALIATPVYQSNILVQVEDGAGSSSMLLGDLASAFDMKSPATAEIEILKSRYIVGRAIKNANLDVIVKPKRFPIIGDWIARGSTDLSTPGLFGFGGYVWGAESVQVSIFSVPKDLEGEEFVLEATGIDKYVLRQKNAELEVQGRIGKTLTTNTKFGTITLHIDALQARKGAKFSITRAPLLESIEKLQKLLVISEKGKQSGVIGISLEGSSRTEITETLNEIGKEYIRQNVERKSEEAEKSLAFLEKQLPQLKRSLEDAEANYNALRNSRGTVDLTEEAKSILQQSVLSQTRLIELKQKRDELLTRYQENNPIVQAVSQQMHTLNAEIGAVNSRIKKMPEIEQDVLRLTRDIKVNTDLYSSLLNNVQQLRLVKASKVGNVRLLDNAVVPLEPIRPRVALIASFSIVVGGILGIIFSVVRKSLFGGIVDPHDIEKALGLPISAAIPHSASQELLFTQANQQTQKVSVLAKDDPTDLAIESLRSFRTSLQFSMLNAKNKMIMITGPTPGVGKSFVSVNFAAVLASTGKRVLLIDGDLRKGYLHRYFGLGRDNGLSDAIVDSSAFEKVVHRQVVENLDFLSSGMIPPHPAELLEHSNFVEVLNRISKLYDLIIIDTPPALVVTDALIVAPHVGAIFNVVRSNVSTMSEIDETVKRLKQGGNNVAGVVFNDLKHRIGGYSLNSKYGRYKYAHYKY